MEIELDFSTPNGRRHLAERLRDASPNELKLIALRAIDHAHKISAEMIENRAQTDSALSQLAGLKNDIRDLTALLDDIAPKWKLMQR